MLNLKRMVCMLLTAGMFTTALPVQALAASDYQYITNISLKVEVDLDAGDEVNSGDSVGTSKDDSGTKVYTTSDKYSVESAEWTNNKHETCTLGRDFRNEYQVSDSTWCQ